MDNAQALYVNLLNDIIQKDKALSSQRATTDVEAMTNFIRAAEQALTAFKTRRNSFLDPVRLPIELLGAIFAWAVRDDVTTRYVELQRYRLVCSGWRDAIDNTPALWSVLSSQHSWRTVQLAVERSSQHPLFVWQSIRYSPGNVANPDFSKTISTLCIERWKHASLNFSSPASITKLDQPAPLLEVLHLSIAAPMDQTYWTDSLFCKTVPRLRELSLQSLAVPWDSPYLKGLRSLELNQIRRKGPTIAQLFGILCQCPDLSSLILNGVAFPSYDFHSQSTGPLTMSKLRRLQLSRLTPASTHQILVKFDFPTLAQFKLICSMHSRNESSLFTKELDARHAHMVNLLQNARTVKIQMRTDSFTCMAAFPPDAAASHSFMLNTRACPHAKPLQWLLNILKAGSSRPCVELLFWDDIQFAQDQELVKIILDIPNLIDVSFTQPNADIPIFLRILGSHRINEEGVLQWPLPDLRILCITGEYFNASDILTMVKSRYGLQFQRPELRHAQKDLPAQFIFLNVGENDTSEADTVTKIQKILGKGVLQWEDYQEGRDI